MKDASQVMNESENYAIVNRVVCSKLMIEHLETNALSQRHTSILRTRAWTLPKVCYEKFNSVCRFSSE